MQFGVLLPVRLSALSRLREFAERAESLGFDSLWTGDHVASSLESHCGYPYRGELQTSNSLVGQFDGSEPVEVGVPDALSMLAFVASCTSRVKLGVSVLILPMRNPVITAHAVATLDVLSSGRSILGIGVGWNRDEFKTLSAPFEHRGARTDEYLEVIRRLWTQENPCFQGRYYDLGDVHFYPRPIQNPHPPFWFGGNGDPTFRRVLAFDGVWHFAFLMANEVAPRIDRLRSMAEAAGKDPIAVPVTGLRIDLIQRPVDEARAEVRALEKAGVSHVIVGLPGPLSAFYTKMEIFSRNVIDECRGN